MKCSVLGLGKLGASMVGAIAQSGFDVIGVDINANAVELLNAGHAPVEETNLEVTIQKNQKRIRATMSHEDAVLNSDMTFVVVPTPSDKTGLFSLQYAKWAFGEIGKALAQKTAYHNVILTSTVIPGSTRYALLPILESQSGKVCGPDFGLCYSPEFIALGSVIRDFLNPDFTLIGEIDERAGEHLEAFYARIMANDPPCKRMSLENAELAKLAVNTFVTTKITYANMLAELCEQLPGGNVDIISDAIGHDSPIGRKYLTGGLGYGGPCFPRDNKAMNAFGIQMGVNTDLSATTDALNRSQALSLAKRVHSLAPGGATVAILGLAYKPYSHVVEESQSISLGRYLSEMGMRVVGYDPLARETSRHALQDKAVVLDEAITCLEQADIVVIATPDPEFAKLTIDNFPHRDPRLIVFDCWRLLKDTLEGTEKIQYISLGSGGEEQGGRLMQLWHSH